MSDNNPWGGNNNRPHKPPHSNNVSIDEITEKLKKKFGGLFGGNSPENSINISFIIFIIVALWGVTGFYRVNSGEQGVVLQFGKYKQTTTSGLNYHLPYPIETVEVIDIQNNRNTSIGYSVPSSAADTYFGAYTGEPVDERQMLTGDENIINIEFDVRWKVSTASDFLFKIKDPEQTIRAVSESVMREIVGKNKIDYILTDGRGSIENESQDEIQKVLNHYKSGVEILQVAIKDASAPEPVIADFQDVQAARADAERFVQEATSYSNKLLPKAKGEASSMIQKAEGYKAQAVTEATGDASRFNKILDEYKKAPEVTKKRLYLETMEKIYADKDKIFIATDKANNIVPYLPLPQIGKIQNSKEQ